MLSIAIVKDSASAGTYYAESDNYYSRDKSPSQWMGDGAKRLGLSGPVDQAAFASLLDGQMPDGGRIHNAADGRRAALDLTFSAPKSLSMQALIGEDSRLIDAHRVAVERALEYVQGLAAYRVTKDGQTQIQKSGNLMIASFLHDLSRDTDPQLHTHAVLVNATQRADGEWRALEPGEILRQKMLIGALYRSELALEVQRLGYEIRLTHTDGRFELAHISSQQVEAFSKRSQAINAVLESEGLTRADATYLEKQRATLATREVKTDVDRAALLEAWGEKSRELAIDLSPRHDRPSLELRINVDDARESVAHAIAHTTERQSVVTEAQILRSALEVGTGTTNIAAIREEISRQLADGQLIAMDGRYTTPVAQEREREILAIESRGRAAVEPILDTHQATHMLSAPGLRAGQQAAAMLMVTTDSRVSAVQGLAGTGKTTMLTAASFMVQQQGYRLIGIAPSAAAARELDKVGIASETIAAFTHREVSGLTSNTVLVVDEASMVSARDMHAILSRVEQAGARVVLIGDVQQLQAVEAGKPFAQLQEAGVARAEMSDIIRQNDATLRHAVELAASGDSALSLATLSQSMVEIDDREARHQAIAQEFAGQSPSDRDAFDRCGHSRCESINQ
jgi:conjugative relaxase-like TrwC/TraI family protein